MDLIDRQAAIDYIDRAITAWSEDKEIAIDCLRNLPSAQPELATDCISRQAAIDEILEHRGAEYHNEYECGYDDALRDAVEWLKRLPSAEPVRMKGKWNKIHWKAYRCSECERVSEYQSNFCTNCGADMRGEQDG